MAFPRSARQASAVIRAAIDAGVSIIPRGAGTSLSGGAIGDGLVVEFSRYNRQIADLDLERRSVRVGAGVVLDQLNAFLRTAWLLFWAGRGDEFARHARWNDRKQFLRRARSCLRHNGGSCALA